MRISLHVSVCVCVLALCFASWGFAQSSRSSAPRMPLARRSRAAFAPMGRYCSRAAQAPHWRRSGAGPALGALGAYDGEKPER